jgi:hypothetical protein
MAKGTSSSWFTRIQLYSECPRFWNWDQAIINESQDPYLIHAMQKRAS